MQSPDSQVPLADRLSAELYRSNAYRVTGLPAEANDREVRRHVEKLTMVHRLGAVTPDVTVLLPLEPPPSLEAIKEAAQRLRNPDTRLVDRFFWFWGGARTDDEALTLLRCGQLKEAADVWRRASSEKHSLVAHHNLAVLLHAMAIDLEHEALVRPLSRGEEDHRGRLWREALPCWRTLLENADFWALWDSIDNDEIAVTARLAAQLRVGLPDALLAINAQLAVAAARTRNEPHALLHRTLLENSGFEESNVERARRRAAQPLIHSITSVCKQSEVAGASEPSRGLHSVAQLLADTSSALWSLAALLPPTHPVLTAGADQILTTVQRTLVLYANTTHDWAGVLPALRHSFSFPGGTETRARLERDLQAVVDNVIAAQCEALSKGGHVVALPSEPMASGGSKSSERGGSVWLPGQQDRLAALRALATLIEDIREAGHLSVSACAELSESLASGAYSVSVTQYDGGARSAAGETLQFALPLARDADTRERIVRGIAVTAQRNAVTAQRKSASSSPAIGWVFLGILGLGFLSSMFDSAKSGPSRSSVVSKVQQDQNGAQAGKRARLEQLETDIERGKLGISESERTLDQLDRSLGATRTEIEGYAAEIEQMEQETQAGLDVDRNHYRLLVTTHNEAVQRHNRTLALRRARFAQYQTLLRATNAQVDAYNSLLR